VAERQPGSREPADDPRAPDRPSDAPSGGPALADSWAASQDGVTGRLGPLPGEGTRAAVVSEPPPSAERSDVPAEEPRPNSDRDAGPERSRRGKRERGSRDKDEEHGGVLGFFRELPVLVVLAFALALLLKTFVVQAFYIPSGSMEPTLMPGDRVLVEKVLYHPSHGDVIVFEDPHPGPQPDRGPIGGFLHWLSQGLGFSQPVDEDFIKRVIGLPGDTVELRHGRLFVNGSRVRQPYLHGEPDLRDYGPTKVPPASLFVLGDNRLNSNDSRFGLGFVPEDRVVGRAFVLIWPPSRVGWLH
jgi:signal peptidase I